MLQWLPWAYVDTLLNAQLCWNVGETVSYNVVLMDPGIQWAEALH